MLYSMLSRITKINDLCYSAGMTVALLLVFALMSGIFATLAGGGGLIQLPALLILMPELSVPSAMGINKIAFLFAAVAGILSYRKHIKINYQLALLMTSTACLSAWWGSHVVTGFSQQKIKPIVFCLFVFVGLFIYLRKKDSQKVWLNLSSSMRLLVAIAIGGLVGFYNGFFGPGAGTLFVFLVVHILGYDFLAAMVSMQILCGTTDLISAVYFVKTGQVIIPLAIIMGIVNGIGAHFGARIAIYKGSEFVRRSLLFVIVLLLLRFGWDIYKGYP